MAGPADAPALSDDELLGLLHRLELGVQQTGARYRRQGAMVIVGAVVMAGIAAVQRAWALGAICLGFGGAIYWLMLVAVRRTGSARAQPVISALRNAPQKVLGIGHRRTSDSMGMFVTHWLEVISADGRIFIKADDWPTLLDQLSRRCPGAKLDPGPQG